MNELIVKPITMSSREIAELCEKEHKDVMRDIRNMLEQLGETSAQFCANLPDTYGRRQPVFNLPKDLTYTLVAGYNVKLRKRIIDRWLQLEERTAPQPPALPHDYLSALKALTAEVETRIALEHKVTEQSSKLEEQAPKVAALECISASEGSMTLTEAANALSIPVRKFPSVLERIGWIYRQNKGWNPYSHVVKVGYAQKWTHPH